MQESQAAVIVAVDFDRIHNIGTHTYSFLLTFYNKNSSKQVSAVKGAYVEDIIKMYGLKSFERHVI